MSPSRYLAFLSYSGFYSEWVGVLHRHLEMALGKGKVYLATIENPAGYDWIEGLQVALAKSERLVLIATPEAFATPWVKNEIASFQALYPHWANEGRIAVARLVDCPLPPFLSTIRPIDMRGHDDARYVEGLKRLLGVIRGLRRPDSAPMLPPDIVPPASPRPVPDPNVRRNIVNVLEPVLESDDNRKLLELNLGFPRDFLVTQPGGRCAASVALVPKEGWDPLPWAEQVIAQSLELQLLAADEGERLYAQLHDQHAPRPPSAHPEKLSLSGTPRPGPPAPTASPVKPPAPQTPRPASSPRTVEDQVRAWLSEVRRGTLSAPSLSERLLTIATPDGLPWISAALIAVGKEGDLHRLVERTNSPEQLTEFWTQVPAGWFWMGSTAVHGSATPRHKVIVEKPFSVSRVRVSAALYSLVLTSSGFHRDYSPATPVRVSWYGAHTFCRHLRELRQEEVRLPAEVEWEYLALGECRPGARDGWPHGRTVRSKNAPWGMRDLWTGEQEWCLDAWRPSYVEHAGGRRHHPEEMRFGHDRVDQRVVRGSSDPTCVTTRSALGAHAKDILATFRLVRMGSGGGQRA